MLTIDLITTLAVVLYIWYLLRRGKNFDDPVTITEDADIEPAKVDIMASHERPCLILL